MQCLVERSIFAKFTQSNLTCIMKKWTLPLLALCVVAAICLVSRKPQPTSLMTDLVSDASALYAGGYRIDARMQDLSDEELKAYQYAEIRSSRPTFGWIVPDMGEGTLQTAYRIVVDDNAADAAKHRGRVWDSGMMQSPQSVAVGYGGEDLLPTKTYYWSVVVETNNGTSAWSKVEPFRTAAELQPYAVSYRPQIREREYAVSVSRTDEKTIFLDFGRASFASLEVTLESDKDNDTIYIAIGEDAKDGRINTKPHGTVRYYRYPLVLRKGRHTYKVIPTPDKRNTGPQAVLVPDYLDEIAPMRYCQIEEYAGDVKAEDVVRHTTIYPFDMGAAHFESDNQTLNAVWELCKYTIKATSALGIYIDGDRERIPYEADAIINQLSHYTTDREYAMGRRTSEHLLEHPTWPTEWILQALIIAWNDYLYTGDSRSIEANYDILKARTLQSLRRENGLISTTDDRVKSDEFKSSIRFYGNMRDIVDWPRCGDWPHGEDDNYHLTYYNTVVNAFHYRALTILQQMAVLTNRTAEATALEQGCRALYEAFNALLFDEEKGVYRDGLDSEHISLHSNLFPLALGLVDESRQPRVMEYIRSRGLVCSVYAAQFLMDAVYGATDGDYGLHLLSKEDERSWYNMVRHGATITYEAWDDKFKNNQDWNHAWGAAPANVIPRYVVGVTPLEAGFGRMAIAPQTSSLKSVKATVPTIRGGVEVEISATEQTYSMRVVIPANTTAEVSLPAMTAVSELYIDGVSHEPCLTPDGRIDCGTIGSGEHTFELRY